MKTKNNNSKNTNEDFQNLLKNNNFKNNQNYVLSKNEKINIFYFMYGIKYENGLTNFMIFLFVTLLLIINGITSYNLTGNFISNSFFVGLFIILLFLMLIFIGFKRILYNILNKKMILYKNTGDNYNEIYSKYINFLKKYQKKGSDFYSITFLDKIDNFNLFTMDKIIKIKK